MTDDFFAWKCALALLVVVLVVWMVLVYRKKKRDAKGNYPSSGPGI